MNDTPTETCIVCGNERAEADYPADWEFVGEVGSGATYEAVGEDAETGWMCLGCRESWESHANTLVVADRDGVAAKVNFKDGILFDHGRFGLDGESYVDVLPDVVEAIVGGAGWVSTDAWRGYHSMPDEAAEYSKVGGGWHSSLTRTEMSDAINGLTDGELHRLGEVERPVVVVYSTTSNVMSTGIDVYAHDDDVEALRDLLNAASAGLDGRVEA